MYWILLSLATAITVATRDVWVKIMSKEISVYDVACLELFWSLPFLIIGMLFIEQPPLDTTFWKAFILSFPLNWASYIFYIMAITTAPLSLTVPLLSFTPVFIILTGSLVLGEQVSMTGGLGILLIVLSSYLLNFNKFSEGVLKPITALFTNRGSILMLLVAFLFSFAAVIGKQAMQHSSPLFFAFSFFVLCNISLLIGLALFKKFSIEILFKKISYGVGLGVLLFFHLLFHSLAIMKANAAYMISIKRSSILFSVILGWYILKEGQIKVRGPAALLMFVGALLITIFG